MQGQLWNSNNAGDGIGVTTTCSWLVTWCLCRKAMKRSLRNGLRNSRQPPDVLSKPDSATLSFKTYKPVLDDASFRAFDTMRHFSFLEREICLDKSRAYG